MYVDDLRGYRGHLTSWQLIAREGPEGSTDSRPVSDEERPPTSVRVSQTDLLGHSTPIDVFDG